MILITLNKIRAHSPCAEGWQKLLSRKGKTSADDIEFPLTDVLDSNGLNDTFWCLQCLPEYANLWRLYAVWRAEQVKRLMTDELSLNALVASIQDDELAAAGAGAAAWAGAVAAAWAAAGAAQKEKLRQILTAGKWVN